MATYDQVHRWLERQLNGLPHYNYGWWLITREHQDVPTLVTTCQFLYGKFGTNWIFLSNSDYDQLQQVIGKGVPPEGAKQVLNRHLLLNMWRPWNLIERQRLHKICPFKLTPVGLRLANGGGRQGLEGILQKIKFVDPQWCRPGVVSSYIGFNVYPYTVLQNVIQSCSGWIDRVEYRLFVARLTNQSATMISRTIDFISSFRTFSDSQRESLITLDRNIFGSKSKAYQNWVDMDLHTFSLFSAGTTFIRDHNILALAGTSTAAAIHNINVAIGSERLVGQPPSFPIPPTPRRTITLRTPPSNEEVINPPTPSININSGQEAEDFVQELLEESGFEVRNFSRMRGFGFDLWIRNRSTNDIFYVEVKSSTSILGTIELTDLEYQAAEKYGEHYLLLCVENYYSEENRGDVWVIQNPWNQIPALRTPITITSHRANRNLWNSVAQRLR